MKVLFFGADIFAVPILETLSKTDNIEICAVITRPAKPAGRGLRPQPNPVLHLATQKEFNVQLINQLKDWENISKIIKSQKPDLAVVAALGMIIPNDVLTLLPQRFINIHPSLLPKYRGPAPIEETILNSDTQTGVSFIILIERLDAGPIIAQYKTQVESNNAQQLSYKLSNLAASKISKVLTGFIAHDIKPKTQDEDQATYSHIITKDDGKISLKDNPQEISRKLKAYYPWPGITVKIKNKEFKIIDATTKSGILYINKIQPSGKKVITGQDFINGYKNLLTYFPKSVILNSARK